KLRLSGYFLKLSNRRHFRSPRGPLLCEPLRTLRLSVIFIPSSFLTFNLQLSTLNCFYPVSPIIPVHTQKQGGVGVFLNFELSTLNCLAPPNSFVFSHYSNHIVIYMNKHIVGAPTFWSAAARRRFSVDTAPPYGSFERNGLHRKSGSKLPHSKRDPYTSCGLSIVNCRLCAARPLFCLFLYLELRTDA